MPLQPAGSIFFDDFDHPELGLSSLCLLLSEESIQLVGDCDRGRLNLFEYFMKTLQ